MISRRIGSLVVFLLLGVLCPACTGGVNVGFGIATRIVFDGAVTDATVARVTRFEIQAMGDESFTAPVALTRAAQRTEQVVYRPLAATRSITLGVRAYDQADVLVASGKSAPLVLAPGKTTETEIILGEGTSPDDAGGEVDLGTDLPTDFGGGGASLCSLLTPADGVVACAGFESDSDRLSPFQMIGAFTLDTTHVHRGTSSLHLETKGDTTTGRTFAEVHYAGMPDAAMSVMRVFVYMKGPPPGNGTRLLDFQQSGPSTFRAISLGVSGAGLLTISQNKPAGSSAVDIKKSAKLGIPFNTWTCLELQITWGNATGGHVRSFMNDNPIADLDIDQQTADSPLLSSAINGVFYDPSPGSYYDMWIDEIVLATAPVGCAK